MTNTFLKTPLMLSAATAALLLCGATTGLAQTLPSYESNGFPITPLQAQAVSPKDMQELLSDPTLAGGGIQASPHQAAVFGAPNQMAQEKVIAKSSPTITKLLPSYESNGFPITMHQAVVLMGSADIQEQQLPDPTFAQSRMQCSPHLVAALKARNHLVAKLILAKLSSRSYVAGG